jgi:16S rRNA (guanine1207-N2)-methyltransferase
VDLMSHYFDEQPGAASEPEQVEVTVAGRTLTLTTDTGVFSRHRVDPGTAVLLRKGPPPPLTGTILDLGCGYGPIACAMAAQAPDAQVWAIDVNERARELTAFNAAANGLGNVTVVAPDDVPAGLRFDAIFSNPPVRVGKDAMRELLARWLRRLAPSEEATETQVMDSVRAIRAASAPFGQGARGRGGRAFLVVQRHLGSDSLQDWLQHEGFLAERLASSKGYRVLVVAGRIDNA